MPASRFGKTQYTSDATHENKLMNLILQLFGAPGQTIHFLRSLSHRSESFTFENMRASANLSILDFVLLPFFLALIYAIAYKIRNSRYSYKHPWRKYFIPALTVKIFGAIFIGLI